MRKLEVYFQFNLNKTASLLKFVNVHVYNHYISFISKFTNFVNATFRAVYRADCDNRQTLGNVGSVRDVSGIVSNVGVAVGIVSPAHCVQ